MSEFQPPAPPWQVRTVTFAIVVLLHVGLLAVAIEAQVDPPGDLHEVAYLVDLPIAAPQPEAPQILNINILAPAPPHVSEPDISVDDSPGAAPVAETVDAPLPTMSLPSAGASGNAQSSGGSGVKGAGSGASVLTTCTNRIMPDYPASAKTRSESGKVTLGVRLNEKGKFADIWVANSSGSQILDGASIAALRRWRCTPVYENGRPVSQIAKQEFEFTLRK